MSTDAKQETPTDEGQWDEVLTQFKIQQKTLEILENSLLVGNPLFVATMAVMPCIQRNVSKSESDGVIAMRSLSLAKEIIKRIKQEL